MPDGEGGPLLTEALAHRGVDAGWAVWDDPAVDWAGADLVAVRSVWDYHRRLPEFLAWARVVEQSTTLLNGAATFEANADKAYLLGLGSVPTVPTVLLEHEGLRAGLDAALERWGTVVVKPRTGASGVGVVVADHVDDLRLAGLTTGPWLAQPLVDSVRTVGETSVYVFDGRALTQADKRPGGGADGDEIRVQEEYGGTTVAAPLDPERAALAERAVAAAAGPGGAAYARVDLMLGDGGWCVSEVELIEPGLYLEVLAENAEHFADVVVSHLRKQV
jgi:glutathione synthase/RimK-type ligase-like ATP-grasp enzyme